jgi:hypothetical protein
MTTPTERGLAGAEDALRNFANGPAQAAAEQVSAAFERAGARMGQALGAGARDGESALKQMVRSVLGELAKIALDRVFPAGRGEGEAPRGAGSAVNVHFHLTGGAGGQDLRRHDSQIAAAVARAVAYGRRSL